jgi:hypothetical protein
LKGSEQMTILAFYQALQTAETIADVENIITEFEISYQREIRWVPLGGRENNKGTVEVSGDTGRSLVERLTNGIDAILELEHDLHKGTPNCRSPKEAAAAWLNVPDGGLSDMTNMQRRNLAQRVTVRILPGDGKNLRTVEVRDFGIGLTPDQMPCTILSLNESNKVKKHYLAGVYGQGGSSTFAACKYTFIASRQRDYPLVGFTLVRYEDLPPDEFKVGRYVYLTFEGKVLSTEIPHEDFPAGTIVKHFGYDLSNYSGKLGPNSIYGLLNQVLFDPVMPIWLEDHEIHSINRVIKGSRNALNGAVDYGDEEGYRGPSLSHHIRLFHTTLGDFGRLGIEYWVLEPGDDPKEKPIKAFVNPAKPIVLTSNGQNQEEMSQLLIRKSAELPYLAHRLIVHVDCNDLTPAAKRGLFVSNREGARHGIVHELIQQEVVKALKTDDELVRLNNEARLHSRKNQDEAATQKVREEVSRLLHLRGMDFGQGYGSVVDGQGTDVNHPVRPRKSRPRTQPLDIHEPPTYVRIVWEENDEITFYPEQRRYVKIETDANSWYHDPHDPAKSRINIIASDGVIVNGSTHLEGGRMRAIFEGASDVATGNKGMIRVELSRTGQPMLFDERPFRIVERPPARQSTRRMMLPQFDFVEVEGPEDDNWMRFDWPIDPRIVASSAEQEDGILMIYYSAVFPKYAEQRAIFERRDPMLAESFTERYKIWLAVHSLLYFQDQQDAMAQDNQHKPIDEDENALIQERQERCRIATVAAMVAAQEVQEPIDTLEVELA